MLRALVHFQQAAMPPRRGRRDEFGGVNKDEAWWQSDGEEGGSEEGDKQEDSNSILCDPDMDDKDAAWVEKKRGGHESDAILSW